MSAAPRAGNDNNPPVTPHTRSKPGTGLARPLLVLPAMAALGIGGHAGALELGALDVQSTLGQPLRASIAYALNPNEEIRSYCIYVSPGRSASGLPSAGPASVVVENGAIRVNGRSAVGDPLIALQVTVDCPYAAHLSREYVAFINPAGDLAASGPASAPAPQQRVRPAAPAAAATPAAPAPAAIGQRAAAAPAARAPIAASATYRVRPGDTLSGIAQRMTGRTMTIWQTVEALFAANTDAFIDGNRDLLKAGSVLRVPDAIYGAERAIPPTPAALRAPAEAAEAPASTPDSRYRGEAGESGPIVGEAAAPPAAGDASRPARPAAAAAPEAAEPPAAPGAGDIYAGEDPVVKPANDALAAAQAAPAATVQESRPGAFEAPLGRVAADSGGAWSWLIWLGGSGIALILALLLGRPLRKWLAAREERGFDDRETDRRYQDPTPAVITVPEPSPDTKGLEVDFHVDETGADARLVQVDGNVGSGSGFQDIGDIDVAEDFGFAASDGIELGLDIEFPQEPAADALSDTDSADTDMIPPIRREEGLVVENETGTYDVSMIVDATQPPVGDSDETTRDLQAIELDTAEMPEDDPLTLSREMDYKILEQDYQDELTATQALNAQLEDAARDLALRLESDDDISPDAPTAKFPRPTSDETLPHPAAVALAEADTVEMPARGGDDDTGVNEELEKDLPAAVNDATAEMEVESATVDTKKMRVS